MESLGRFMTLAAWALALALLTWLFAGFLEDRADPNRNAQGQRGDGGAWELVLRRNSAGHYLARGRINDQPVTFLVDTGATEVGIPEALARRLGLAFGRAGVSRTAGGDVRTWSTRLRSLEVGGIQRRDLRAIILPELGGEEILLGMNFLKGLEMTQKGDTLTLRLPNPSAPP